MLTRLSARAVGGEQAIDVIPRNAGDHISLSASSSCFCSVSKMQSTTVLTVLTAVLRELSEM